MGYQGWHMQEAGIPLLVFDFVSNSIILFKKHVVHVYLYMKVILNLYNLRSKESLVPRLLRERASQRDPLL